MTTNYNDIISNIRVISDIHLEFYSTEINYYDIITPNIYDILILAGDIGNPFEYIYKNFLLWCRENFLKVCIIAGNHEYYGNTIEDTNRKIEEICNSNSIIFLNNSVFIHKNIAFIGTTLWSYIPDENKNIVQQMLNDYRFIKNFTVDINNSLFNINVKFIKDCILEFKGKYKIVIISHHTPSLCGTSYYELETRATNCAFSSDLSHIIRYVDMWIYGHTHYNNEGNVIMKDNIPLVSNQYGYIHKKCKNYDKNFFIKNN